MDTQEKVIIYSCCDHCGKDAPSFHECIHCMRQVCGSCIYIGNDKKACPDCYFQVFAGDLPPLGESLYVITTQNRS